MKRLLFLIIPLLLVACGDDEQLEPSGKNVVSNTNSNAQMITKKLASGVTEKTTTNLQAAANRLEIPRLKGGEDNLFVVHTIDKYGINYCMEYDCGLMASRWTAYQWYKGFSSNESNFNRSYWESTKWRGDPFQEDPLIPQHYRTTLEDHTSNGHDRGHMLGSADRLNSQDANEQTFYLSNMHPQLNGFNASGIWFSLESKLRKDYDTDSFRDTLYVVKGGTISQGMYTMVQGRGNPLVCPKYFYMALLCKNSDETQGGYKAIAFWMEHKANKDTDYKSYAISIDQLEKNTGLDFFCNLPDDIENEVEKNMTLSAWKLN